MHATTILSVRKDGQVVRICYAPHARASAAASHAPSLVQAVVGDGQITQGSQIVKSTARKVRRLGSEGVVAGFAGATADCLALVERLEVKLEQHPGQLTRACVDLAKEWRTEKYLRRLEAVMLVVDEEVSLTVTGGGDVIEPPDGIIAIGSGGAFALGASAVLRSLTPTFSF